jgi:proline iminopeptidase
MNRTIFLLLSLAILSGCKKQQEISGPLNIPDALLTYTAEGNGIPCVIFTGGENIGQKVFPKALKDHFILIHADPSKIDSSVIKDISLDDILDDLEKLRISIGVEKIGILGHSMFGLLPFEYAAKYPNNISFVISTGSVPFQNDISSKASQDYWESEASDERKNILQRNLEEIQNVDWNALSPTQQFITYYTAETPFRFCDPHFDQTEFWEGVEINMNFLNHYYGKLMNDFDNSDQYKSIKAPVIVVTGKYDFGAPYYLWEEFIDIIPDFTLKVYNNAGHNPFMEIPQDFTQDLLQWVNRTAE